MAYSLETSSVKTIVPGAEVSGFADVVARQKISTLSGEVPKLSAGEGIDITSVNGKTVITNNISAGENISIVYDMESNTYRIDGNAAGHTYTGIEPIQVNNTTDEISITGESISAGPGIDMFSSGGYVVISANGGGGGGAIYTGISPIDVNNTTHQISAKGVSFGVQEPLFFVQDDNEAVIIGCSAGGGGTTYTGDAQGALDEVYANSGVWLTAHQDLSNYYTTAEANTLSSMLSGAIDYVSGAVTGSGEENNVFIAEYGITTSNEIQTALSEGKEIICKCTFDDHPDIGTVYLPTIRNYDIFHFPNESIKFGGVVHDMNYNSETHSYGFYRWLEITYSTYTSWFYTTYDYDPLQVQADWNVSSTSSKAYIKNKPDLTSFITSAQVSSTLTGYQTKLDSIDNIVLTASLPATPDANTLYLIPEA